MKKIQPYMLFPFFVFAAAFWLDKQLFVGDAPNYFLRTASFINYEHKEDLINDLDAYLKLPDRKRVWVMFGSSRTMSFDPKYLAEKHPAWILFNFSVPGGNNDYYHRYMEAFHRRGIRPDLLTFAVTPQGFNARPAVSLDEVMLNGLPVGFVARHADRYRVGDLTNYAAKKLFWSYRYRVNWGTIVNRLEDDSKDMIRFKQFRARSYTALLEGRGSVAFHDNPDPDQDPAVFRREADSTWRSFYTPYLPAEGQFQFAEGNLALAQELGVRARMVWAPVGPELRALLNEKEIKIDDAETTVRAYWEKRMRAMAERRAAPLVDLNFAEQLPCDRYYDVSHLAGVCFGDFTDRLLAEAP